VNENPPPPRRRRAFFALLICFSFFIITLLLWHRHFADNWWRPWNVVFLKSKPPGKTHFPPIPDPYPSGENPQIATASIQTPPENESAASDVVQLPPRDPPAVYHPPPAHQSPVSFAVVNLQRVFASHPEILAEQTRDARKRAEIETETARLRQNGATENAREYQAAQTKELENESAETHQRVTQQILQAISSRLAAHNLTMVLDSSGKSFNGVPIVLASPRLPDLTDEIIAEINREVPSP
jgi:Skp family chaperone for outer membrane proteins